MGTNLLKNPGFESGKFIKVDNWGSMTVPDGWRAFFIDTPGKKVPWDKKNESGILAPEFKPVDNKPPYLDPPRVHSGYWSECWFAFWKVMDAGLYQQVSVTPGQQLRLSAWAHGWSNLGDPNSPAGHAHDPKWSDGKDVGYADFFQIADPAWPNKGNSTLDDAGRNMVFQLGIDPAGGTDAFASSVVWGPAAHIYNVYHAAPPVEAVAQSSTVTVFLRTRNLWGFQHNDAYWDDPVLEAVGEAEPPPPGPGTQPPPEPELGPQPGTRPARPIYGPTGMSKLGAHILVMNDDTAKFIAAGPTVVKFVGDWGSAGNVPAGTLVIGRKVLSTDDDAQAQRAQGLAPEQAVHKFIYSKENQVQTYQSNSAIKCWEGHNEPVWNDLDGMKWYADFEIARMQEMAKLGLRCVIGNFATGTPPMQLWPGFIDALHAAKQYDAILGLHEYSCPWLWWMTGYYQMQVENCVDPRDPNRIEGWTTLRYRQIYRQYLEPAGLGDLPLVITEFGIDPLVNPKPSDAPPSAWRGLANYWNKHKDDAMLDHAVPSFPPPEGVEHMTSLGQYYFEQLKWYDREMQKDPFVIGATIFTFGSFGGDWARFDVTGADGVAGLLTEYVTQSKTVPPPPPSTGPNVVTLIVQPDVTLHGGLKVRVSRNVEASYVEALSAGAQVTVLEGPIVDGGEKWVHIRAASGNEGWVRQSGDGETYLA